MSVRAYTRHCSFIVCFNALADLTSYLYVRFSLPSARSKKVRVGLKPEGADPPSCPGGRERERKRDSPAHPLKIRMG